jgi:hypothetical protein
LEVQKIFLHHLSQAKKGQWACAINCPFTLLSILIPNTTGFIAGTSFVYPTTQNIKMIKIALLFALVNGFAACGDADTTHTTSDSTTKFIDSSTMILDSAKRVDSIKMLMDTSAKRP